MSGPKKWYMFIFGLQVFFSLTGQDDVIDAGLPLGPEQVPRSGSVQTLAPAIPPCYRALATQAVRSAE